MWWHITARHDGRVEYLETSDRYIMEECLRDFISIPHCQVQVRTRETFQAPWSRPAWMPVNHPPDTAPEGREH